MNAGSPCSAAHHARPSPRSSATLPDLALVRRRRRAQDELLVVLDEVDEARVHAARVRHEPHDRGQHLVELERRRDRRDDLLQELLARLQGHRADAYDAARRAMSRADAAAERPPSGISRDRNLRSGRFRSAQSSVQRDRAHVALPRARLEDLGDLVDHEPELVVGREEVRPEADPRARAEVAEDRRAPRAPRRRLPPPAR